MGDEVKGDKYVFNNSKIGAVGRNARSGADPEKPAPQTDQSALKTELKALLASNRIADCLEKLLVYLKQVGNEQGLNLAIHQSAAFHELSHKEKFDLIPAAEVNLRKNKLIHAMMHIIDSEIGK
ncbi:MAG: hypothetical protein AAFN10_12210 [Bacteroidota bacterium]